MGWLKFQRVKLRNWLSFGCDSTVNRASVRPILASRADHGVFFVFDGPEIEKCLVKLGQSRQAVRAQIHVMKLEFHG